MHCREKENKHWSRRKDVRVNRRKTGLICGSVERLEAKQIRGFFMGCERALLSEKKKNTLRIIGLSLGSDNQVQCRERSGNRRKGVFGQQQF